MKKEFDVDSHKHKVRGHKTQIMNENFSDLAKLANQINIDKHSKDKNVLELIEDELETVWHKAQDKDLTQLQSMLKTLKAL